MEANDKSRYAIEVGFFNESTARLGLSSSLSWIFPCTGRLRCEDSRWRMDQLMDNFSEENQIVATVGLPEVALTSGKWFYEVEITEVCDPQFGWALRGWEPLCVLGQYGCGEDRFSYAACNGGFFLHNSEPSPQERRAPLWSVGDTVGFMLDLDGREIRFSVNGECNEFVFRSIGSVGYYPALSMRAGVVDINFGGSRALKFLPNGYTPVAEQQKKQMRAERDALDTKIEAMEKQLHRGTERLGVKKKHEATTVEGMQEALVARLDGAYKELKAFNNWNASIKDAQFVNPTIKRVLGGLTVKLTFGSRGEKIGIEPIFFAVNRNAKQIEDALNCLATLHSLAEDGAFNDKLAKKLASYQERAEKGKERRKQLAEEKRNANQPHLQVA